MEYIHIKNLKKFHPGYQDRTLQWAKIFINMADGDPDTELIENEIDWARFVKMILLELRAQKPLPNTEAYWLKKGFNLKKRSMSLTLQVLHNFIETVTPAEKERHVEESRVDKEEDKDKSRVDYCGFEETTLNLWNSFCDKYPTLPKIKEITDTRRKHLKERFSKDSFKDFQAILGAAEQQPFLIKGNPNSKDHKDWKISFDWLIGNDTNYIKVLEFKYKEKRESDIKAANLDCKVCKGTGWAETGEGRKNICHCRISK